MDTHPLNIYDQEIRQRFREELAETGLSLGAPFDYLVGERRFLGLWHGPLISEIIGIDNHGSIIDLSIASLYGRCFVIAQDQVIDHGRIELVPTISLMLGEFLTRIYALTSGSIAMETRSIIKENAMHNAGDVSRRERPPVITMDNLGEIGKKTIVAVIPSIASAVIANKPRLREMMASITYRYLVAIQIADDLADIEEDEANGRFTAVNTLYRNLGLQAICEYAIRNLEAIIDDLVMVNPAAQTSILYFQQIQKNYIAASAGGDLQAFDPEVIQTTDL